MSVVLRGPRGDTDRIVLTCRPEDFQRAKIDTFVVDAADVGAALTCLIVGHDNAGRAPAWLLERVEVTHMPTGTVTVFTCGEWLDVADGARR